MFDRLTVYILIFITWGKKARENGIANSLNPNLVERRDIPKVLNEVTAAFTPTKPGSYPGPLLRLLGLINHFKKERGVTGLAIDAVVNQNDYSLLKKLARHAHTDMEEEIYKDLRREGKPVVLTRWSELRTDMIARYAFKLEKTASDHGMPLARCQNSWAAILLLSETHKYKSCKSRNKAAVFGERR